MREEERRLLGSRMAAVEVLERVARHAEDSRASRGRSVGEPRARTSGRCGGGLRRCQVGQDRGGLRARCSVASPSARRVRADNGSHRRHPLLLRKAPPGATEAFASASSS
ncbi:hypothetical protein MTO96_012006 [Rhipicephalus appendiculatus]